MSIEVWTLVLMKGHANSLESRHNFVTEVSQRLVIIYLRRMAGQAIEWDYYNVQSRT